MELIYVLIAALFTIIVMRTFIVNRELDDLTARLREIEYKSVQDTKHQTDINNSLISNQDKMLSRFGDLNTRVIELEARLPEEEPEEPEDQEPEQQFVDIQDEGIII